MKTQNSKQFVENYFPWRSHWKKNIAHMLSLFSFNSKEILIMRNCQMIELKSIIFVLKLCKIQICCVKYIQIYTYIGICVHRHVCIYVCMWYTHRERKKKTETGTQTERQRNRERDSINESIAIYLALNKAQ